MRHDTIGSCIEEVQSWNPARDAPEEVISYIDLGAVDNVLKTLIAPQRVLGGDAPSRARQRVNAGDILVSTVRPYLNGVARVPDYLDGATASTGFCVVRPDRKKVDASYLFHWLKAPDFIADMVRKSTGASYPAVSDRIIHQSLMPLRPLPEQQRIAAILDQADALRRLRQRSLSAFENLGPSLFATIIGDPVSNPQGWDKAPLAQCVAQADDIRCGPFGTQLLKHEFTDAGVPLWGIKQVNRAFGAPTHEFVSEAKARSLSNYDILPGDIVMTRKGTVGNCAVYPADFPPGIMHSDLLRVRLDSARCHPVFLSDQLHWSADVAHQIDLISGGAIMKGINVGKLKQIVVLKPPIEVQEEYVRMVDASRRERDRMRGHLTEIDTLFTSLQHRAFNGDL